MFDKQLYRRVPFIGVLLALSVFSGVACDAGTEPPTETVTVTEPVTATETVTDTASQAIQSGAFTSASSSTYFGVWSLPELIIRSDVIAVVDLSAVDRGVERWKRGNEVVYTKTLEFTFDVEQYLKGAGKDQVVGIVFDFSQAFDTAAGVETAKDPLPDRKEHWDDRKAVVFLRDDAKDPQVNWDAGRYYLGLADGAVDQYSVANRWYRAWLPAVKNDDRRFLLESDLNPDVLSPETITLDNLKILVSSIDQELAGRTEEYKECIFGNYAWERQVRHDKESLELQGAAYYYVRSDSTVESGMPKGAKVFTSDLSELLKHARNEYPLPEGATDKYVLAGRDAEYFVGAFPGEIFAKRPLPQGEYKAYHAHLPYDSHMCGGTVPEDEMGRQELFLTVKAPPGTLHEAFFDPVTDGKTVVAAGGTVGVLEPATFTDANGALATIQRIAWEAEAGGVGTVKLTLSPHNSIAGHTVEFIALDGSVPLSLAVADAQVDATNGTLTWKVASQPWQAGDKLMLRVTA